MVKLLVLLNELIGHYQVSLTKVSLALFGDTNPFNVVRTEYLLDELWEYGFVINMGSFCNYDWAITEKGIQLSDYIIVLLGDHQI